MNAKQYRILWDEIKPAADEGDPLGRGYESMTDQQVADDLNSIYATDPRTRNKKFLSGDEVFTATDPAELAALDNGSGNTSDEQGMWVSFCGRSSIDPFATANVQFVVQLFGSGSVTVASLTALRVEDISRAQELGLGHVKTGHVKDARQIV